jgi:hypothetical protein
MPIFPARRHRRESETHFEDPCFLVAEECAGDTGQTFDELPKTFESSPPGDALFARLWLRRSERPRSQVVIRQDAVVAGHEAIAFVLEK